MFLALDTSTLTLSMALLERRVSAEGPLNVVEHVLLGPPRKQSEMLPGVVGELLDRHGVKLAELEGIVSDWGQAPSPAFASGSQPPRRWRTRRGSRSPARRRWPRSPWMGQKVKTS